MECCNTVANVAVTDILADFRQYVANTKMPPEVAETLVCYIGRIEVAARRDSSRPLRNCDVGTADEQYARWRDYCDKHKCGPECPVYKLADVIGSKTKCNLVWSQMPYDEAGHGER